jgi:hypothetical protein
MSIVESVSSADVPQPRAVTARSGFYAGMSAFLLAIVLAGFWPQYYWPLLQGVPLKPLLQHWGFAVHSTVSLGWMLLFALQSTFVWRGRTALHRQIGPYLAAYGVLLIIANIAAGLGVELRRMELGDPLERAAAFTFLIVRDIGMFGAFMAAAIVYRKRPELHKRLMFLATFSLAMVGVGRLVGRFLLPDHPTLFQFVCLTPIMLAMVHDWRTQRRAHAVYAIGLLLFFLRLQYANFNFGRTEFWQPIGRAMLQPFM